ncbi:MAG: glycosyltransferase family 4 protein, partial [Gammaproteobacteria bacterium]
SVPSRSYNIMCAGKPILTVAPDDGEISLLIEEKGVGWIVPPGQPDRCYEVVKGILENREQLKEMGEHCRKLAEEEYSSAYIINRYADLVREFIAN